MCLGGYEDISPSSREGGGGGGGWCNDRMSSVNDYPASLSQHVTRPLLKQFAPGVGPCGRSFVSLRIYLNPLSRTDVTIQLCIFRIAYSIYELKRMQEEAAGKGL